MYNDIALPTAVYVWYMCVIKYFIRRRTALKLYYNFNYSISIQVAKFADDRHRRCNANAI